MGASPLECMICDRAYTVMHAVRHRSGNLIYQGRDINFFQEFSGFFRSGCIPRSVNNTPYLVLVNQGCDDVIVEARVLCHVVKLLSEYYIDNITVYVRLDIKVLNLFPEDGIVQAFLWGW